MRLTVFGATGGVGNEIVRQALDEGHQVTAVVRDPRRLHATGHDLQVLTVPDLTRPEALTHTVDGTDAVLSATGPSGRTDKGITSTVTAAVTTAMLGADVRRLVVVSAVPVGPAPPGESLVNRRLLMPLLWAVLGGVYADLAAMEQGLRDGPLDWTVVRPPRLVDGPRTGRYRTSTGSNVPRSTSIGRADVADLMLRVLADPAAVRQLVGISR